MLRVGLTGGIACGKSQVLRGLARRGLRGLDLDEVAHEVTRPGGPAHDEVVAAFGPGILGGDGAIDRKALGAIVFADPSARARLDAIVHPKVRGEEARQAAALASEGGDVFVTDAALLVEAGVHLRFDRLVVVHCAEGEQLRRLRERDGLPEDAARARIAAQMPIAEKRRFAHFEVDTSGSLEATDRAADALAETLRATAHDLPAPAPAPEDRALACLQRGPAEGPRGLTAVGLLADLAAAGGLEMARVARLLVPACSGPWYRCATSGEASGPESIVGPIVLWALARGGPDPPVVAAAAASLARLTHRAPSAIAGSCLAALCLLDAAEGRPIRSGEWRRLAERWGGAPPSPGLESDDGVRGAQRGLREGGSTPDPSLSAALEALSAATR